MLKLRLAWRNGFGADWRSTPGAWLHFPVLPHFTVLHPRAYGFAFSKFLRIEDAALKQDFRMRFVGKLKLLDEKTRAGQNLEEIEAIMSPGDWEALTQ